MKKLLALLVCVLSLSCIFVACDDGGETPEETQQHKHAFETTWTTDEDGHWYAATCGCQTKANFASHTDDDKDGICDICEYAGDHEHTYKTDWTHDDEKHWHDADCGHAVKSDEGNHKDAENNGLCDDCGWNFDHEHSYKADWSHDAEYHWYDVACSHQIDVKDKAPHADEDNNGICDGCAWDYDHTHTYAETWSHDADNHWHDAACGHSVTADTAPHADENNDGICDGCAWNYDHTHTYQESNAWTYNELQHWHAPTCGHSIAGIDTADHTDKNHDRVCDTCGYDFDHVHTYNKETWTWDKETHYHEATCGCAVTADAAKHVDENNNGECDVCLYNFGHAHAYEETWTHDKTYHWHAPSCGHDVEGSDKSEHIDENNDSLCDICAWNYDHTHTYDTSKWTVGVNSHYHAPTCGHNPVFVREGEVAHDDKNRDDICDTCGGYVSMEVVVENATSADAAGKVSSGTIKDDRYTENLTYNGQVSYEFGNGYLHIVDNHRYFNADKTVDTTNAYEHWYETYADGQKIFAISVDGNSPEPGEAYRNLGIETVAQMAGVYFSGEFISYGLNATGVEDLLYQLYYLKDGDNGAGVRDFIENYDDKTGYYSFMFGYGPYNYGVYFKIGADFVIESMIVTGGSGYADMNTEGKAYAITITQKAGERVAKNPYDPDNLLINSFVVKDPNGHVLSDGDQIEVLAGSEHMILLQIQNILPETANPAFDKITAVADDSKVLTFYNASAGTVIVNGQLEGVHDLILTSDHVSITIKVKVTYPAPTEIGPFIYEGDGNTKGDSQTKELSYSMILGSTLYFNAAVNEHADSRYAVNLSSGDKTAVTMEAATIQFMGRDVNVTSFTASKAGTYVVQIGSISNKKLIATLTITVVEKPAIHEMLNGYWEANFYNNVYYEVTFKPDFEGATKGKVEIVDKSHSGMEAKTYTTTYTYEYFEDGIQLTYASGDEMETVPTLTINENFELFIGNFKLVRP